MTQPVKVPSVTSSEPALPIDRGSLAYRWEGQIVETEDNLPIEQGSPAYRWVRPIAETEDNLPLARAPKYRSDLAFAAGFTALGLIFSRLTFIPWLFEHYAQYSNDLSDPEGFASAVWFYVLLPLPGFPAPLALWLGVKAWADLMRHPDKSGRAPATIGLVIGFLGTLVLLSEIYQFSKLLWSIHQV